MFRFLPSLAATLLSCFIGAVLFQPAFAQPLEWPTRTVKFIVPLGAGSGADIGARLLALRLQAKWGAPVVVENKPGGDGLISISTFMSANDDHVLLFASPGSFTVHPYQHEKLPYSFERDLLPIAQFSNTIIALAASSTITAVSLKDLVERAKAYPGQLNSAVPAGIGELILDNFIKTEGLIVQKVPYRDIVQAAGDLAAGRLQFMMGSYAMLVPATQGRQATIIAVNSRKRMPKSPDVPTAVEAGFGSLELEGLVGLFGPNSMSIALREKIGRDVVIAGDDADLSERLLHTGQVLNLGGAGEFGESIKQQMEQVRAIAKFLGMKPK